MRERGKGKGKKGEKRGENLGEKGRKQERGSKQSEPSSADSKNLPKTKKNTKCKEGVAEEQEREAAFQKRGIKITSRHKWCYFWLHNVKIYLEIGERFAKEAFVFLFVLGLRKTILRPLWGIIERGKEKK